MTSLSEKEIAEMREVFDSLDNDKSGQIKLEDFGKAVESLNYPKQSQHELEALFNYFDVDHSGVMDFSGLVYAMIKIRHYAWGENIVLSHQQTFNLFDSDGDGRITEEELYHMVNRLAADISREKVESKLRKVDKDNDNQIDFLECKQILTQLKVWHEKSKLPCGCVLL